MSEELNNKLSEANKRLALCDDLLDALEQDGTYISEEAQEIYFALRPYRTLQVK